MTITTPDMDLRTNASAIDEQLFRDAAGHFASGVAVITTISGGRLYGTTASAVTSLSMEPPMMLVCLNRSSATHDVIVEEGRFGISILSGDQLALARCFAGKGDDKFAGIDIGHIEGVPMISGSIATMLCQTETTAIGGTHTVFLARVSSVQMEAGHPLTYYRGGFGSFQPLPR